MVFRIGPMLMKDALLRRRVAVLELDLLDDRTDGLSEALESVVVLLQLGELVHVHQSLEAELRRRGQLGHNPLDFMTSTRRPWTPLS